MLIEKKDISKFIPQREPFVMVDELLSASELEFKSTFQIKPGNIFLLEEVLSDSALLENIAQTCAAGFGYLGSLKESKEPKIGFIGAISKVEILSPCNLNYVLNTKINILNRFDNIYLIEGVVESNSVELIKCQMKIIEM